MMIVIMMVIIVIIRCITITTITTSLSTVAITVSITATVIITAIIIPPMNTTNDKHDNTYCYSQHHNRPLRAKARPLDTLSSKRLAEHM